jgi:tetratricopeptide (TPR) repeat protein
VRWLAPVLLAGALAGADLIQLEEGSSGHLTLLGNEALVQGRLDTAAEMFQRAISIDRTNLQAIFNLALTHQQQGRYDDARRWYDEAQRLSPGNADVLNNLGIIAYRQGDFPVAVARFSEAARAASGTPAFAADSWFNLGTAHERLSAPDDARRAYEEALAVDGGHAAAHFNLGTLYLGPLGDRPGALERARTHLGRAVALDGLRPDAWINLGLCDERRQRAGVRSQPQPDPDQAFATAVEVANGRGRLAALWARAQFFNRSQPPRRVAMRDDLRRILAEDAAYPEANGLLGAYHFAIGEFDQAIVHLEREVAGDADDGTSRIDLETHFLLALIYTDHRIDPTRALAHATAYYRRDPDSPRIHDLRRRALRLGGGAVEPMDGRGAAPAGGSHGSADAQAGGDAHPAPAPAAGHGNATSHGTADGHAAPAREPAGAHGGGHATGGHDSAGHGGGH